jgi:hypothetical protein
MTGIALTDEQIAETLAAIEATRNPDKSINKCAAARRLDIPRTTLQSRVKILAGHGLLGFAPVMPGFEVKEVNTQLDASGAVKATSIKQQRERGEVYAVQKGMSVKGTSTLVSSDGRIAQQWIKTDRDKIDALELAAQIRSSFEKWVPSFCPPAPAPEGVKNQLALFPISDLHVGMLAWRPEAGEAWDLKIAEKVILDTYARLISMTPQTDSCIILFGGDQQHADNFDGMTERGGHVLDVDGRYPKVYFTLCRIAVEIVMMARARHRKIEIRVLQGNHDRHSAIALAYFLYAWFREDPQVRVDVDPSLFWFFSFGSVLLCAVHGHTIKARDLAGKVAATQPKRWGNSILRYCHYFHEHHDEIVQKDEAGLKVEKHAIIAPADAYAAAGPWAASRNAKSIVYDCDNGEIGRSVVNIIPASARVRHAA